MDYLIKVGGVIDGVSDSVTPPKVIGVTDNRIEFLADPEEVSRDKPVFDASEYIAMPGLIDCHIHVRTNGEPDRKMHALNDVPGQSMLRAVGNAQEDLRSGYTTLRDCGGMEALALRNAAKDGEVLVPRIMAAAYGITATAGHMDQDRYVGAKMLSNPGVADSPDEVRRVARELLKLGVDLIKTNATGGSFGNGHKPNPGAQQMTEEELAAAVEVAEMAGKKVASHAMGEAGIRAAVNAGVHSIEHGFWLTEDVAAQMAQQGTFLVPTMSTLYRNTTRGFAGPDMSEETKEELRQRAVRVRQRLFQSIGYARENGVKIVAGSDMGGGPFLYHGECATELGQLVEAGLSEMEAIRAATSLAAELLDREDVLGQIAEDYWADFILVDGDPSADISVLEDGAGVRGVFLGGKAVMLSRDLSPDDGLARSLWGRVPWVRE
ncbi:MAG: amidohydrolase family protein [Clostridia bacterium]